MAVDTGPARRQPPPPSPGRWPGRPGEESVPGAPWRDAGPPPRRWLTPGPWLLPASVGAAVLLSSTALQGIIDGWSWFPAAFLTVCVVLAASTAARILRRGPLAATLCGLAALALVLTAQFLPGHSLLGFIPTPGAWQAVSGLADDFQLTIITEVAPVLPGSGIVFFTAGTLGLLALLMDILAVSLAMPALSGLGLLTVLAISSMVKADGAGLPAFLAGCLGYLLILGSAQWLGQQEGAEPDPGGRSAAWVRRRSGSFRRAVALGGAAVAVTVVLPLAVPGFTAGAFPQGSRLYLWGQPTGLNPILNLGENLRSPIGLAPVKYYTDSPAPLYLRATTIDELTGERWQPSVSRNTRISGLGALQAPGLDRRRPTGTTTTTQIETGNFTSPWLLAPYAPVSVAGVDGSWSWEPDNLSILAGDRTTTAHQVYLVRSVAPVITAAGLAAAGGGTAEVDPRFSELPDGLPAVIGATADQVLAGLTTDYAKALALQNFLRAGGFTYSEQAPIEGGYDGNGIGVVAAFLEQRSGYCVHFSAAMAVMARYAGIPSRIAVGFSPGSATGGTTTTPLGVELAGYSLTSRNAHAWPELYFAGFGWVPFEPTPGRGVLPRYAPGPVFQDLGSGLDLGEENPTSNPTGAPAVPTPIVGVPGAQPGTGPAADDAGQLRIVAWLAGGGAGAVLLLAVPVLLRVMRRRRALFAADRLETPAAARLRWSEVLNTAADHHRGRAAAETAAAFERRLLADGAVRGPAAPALIRLRRDYERAEYAPPVPAGAPAGARGGTALPPRDSGPRSAEPRTAGPGSAGQGKIAGPGSVDPGVVDPRAEDLRAVTAALAAASGTAGRLRARLLPASLWPFSAIARRH